MNHRYLFEGIDNFVTIIADSLCEAEDRLKTFLSKNSEEIYTIDDYTLVEEEPNYV